MRALTLLLFGLVLSNPVYAESKMITKKSSHSVAVTMDRLEAALKEKEIGVVARVDHAAAAKKADMALKPTQVLIFGNPKLGTPLMQSNPRAARLAAQGLGLGGCGGRVGWDTLHRRTSWHATRLATAPM